MSALSRGRVALAPLYALDPPAAGDLVSLRLLAGLSVEDAAELVGLTVRRYRAQETGRAPVAWSVYRLLWIVAGALPWARWRGWACIGGQLYAPDLAHGFRPDQVGALPYLWQLVAALKGSRDEAPASTASRAGRVHPSPHHRRRQVSQVACAGTAPQAGRVQSEHRCLQPPSRPGKRVIRGR